jgi:uncharacterized Fe-S cluster-containing MiaB family protein
MDEEKRRVTASVLVEGIEKRGSQKPPILHSLSTVLRRKKEIAVDLISDRLRRPSR